jgi:hypothetical protein
VAGLPRRRRGAHGAPSLTRRRLPRGLAVALVIVAACRSVASSSGDAGAPPVGTAPATPTSAAPSATPPSTGLPTPPPPSSETYPLFRKTTLALDELARLVTAAPELARVGTELAFFDPTDGSYIVRSTADRQGISFSSQPILWSPEPGRQVLVVAARGKAVSFVAAWWLLPDGSYRLASTFVMMGEIAPVALAYKPTERNLWWTSCWQCPGETGHLSVRDDHHVVIVQD